MTPTTPGSKPIKFLDLFAGCGGLSLGLEDAGLELVAAVELSDMAAETHFRNFHLRGKGWGAEQQALWEELKDGSFVEQVRHGTVVGDIWDLLADSSAMLELKKLSPEVIVGGPPCQGFSMAGRRNPDDKRNQLPRAFLDMVEALDPKAVVIENVAGINMAFAKRGGMEPPFALLRRELEVAGVKKGRPGYVVQPVEVNARHFGVPQNRPRMMLIALRKDLADAKDITGPEDPSKPWRSQGAFDALPNPKGCTPQARRGSEYMPELELVPEVGSVVDRRRNESRWPREYSAKEGLIDIDVNGYKDSGRHPASYVRRDHRFARAMRGPRRKNPGPLLNHKERNHSKRVIERFALYHLFNQDRFQKHFAETRRVHNLVPSLNALLGLPSRRGDKAEADIKKVLGDLADDCPEDLKEKSWHNLVDVVMRLDTRKHTQRVVPADEPAPTVVTLPDDYVHHKEPRIMTVRELARFQSFPDWFEFCSKETTGSHRRKVEVPQYSQVGNAVPPLMAQAIGELLKGLLADD
jgi:DNA (cytosine-5)-methyltransferase 1